MMKAMAAKKWMILPMLAFLAMTALPQLALAGTRGKIAGKVTDAETGEPLAGANVIIQGTALGAAADTDGDYFIISIPPGTYTVQASMIGYQPVARTEVSVRADHTTPVNFGLSTTALELEAIEVIAEREVIRMDESASVVSATSEEIYSIPLVTDMEDFLELQVGVEGELIRGGGLDQQQLMVDGLSLVDNAANRPIMMVNLSAIKEVNIIKGGFNAEYGNARSGVINVITKEGDPHRFQGSVDYRYTLPQRKHRGASLYDPDNYFLRPYLDPEVCWDGTSNWDAETRSRYPEFAGWNSYASDEMTPEEARNLFIWRHRATGDVVIDGEVYGDGAEGLGHPRGVGRYGHKPDVNIDMSLSGPVPFIGAFLGDMTFFGSIRDDNEMFAMPAAREFYHERNTEIKLTSHLTRSMKLTIQGLMGEINTVLADPYTVGGYMEDTDNFPGDDEEGEIEEGLRGIYYPQGNLPFDVFTNMYGVSFEHILSPKTFYTFRISYVDVEYDARVGLYSDDEFRDTETLYTLPGPNEIQIDESPWGYDATQYWYMFDQMVYGPGSGDADESTVNTLNIKFDLTSQVNKYHQLKLGFMYNRDDHYTHHYAKGYDPTGDFDIEWEGLPIRAGAYIQDQIEYEGMIANVGLRFDYNNPNVDWYGLETYSKYFTDRFKGSFLDEVPKEAAETHLKVSPRLGISHPISEVSKLYFNYGHFYSMPESQDMYHVNFGRAGWPLSSIGNPNLELPRTIQYELGYEHDIGRMYRIHLAGYYKDVGDQTAGRNYTSYDGSIQYETMDNSNYEDIRGFELRIDKRFGRWWTGWLNFDYRVSTEGHIGREEYYQDPNQQRLYGLRNPDQEKPLPEPLGRANVRFFTPHDWGLLFGGLEVNMLYEWQAGRWDTWEPVPPFKAENNIQWRARQNVDLRISKETDLGVGSVTFFVDIINVFNWKYISMAGFANASDYRDYMTSLHLPIYKEDKYEADPSYVGGDDRPGDIKSDDKDYINMPNREFLTYLNPRSIQLGLIVEF